MRKTISILFIALSLMFIVLFNAQPSFAQSGSAGSSGASANFRIAPLSLLIGWLNLDLDFKISDDWTVGPTIGVWRVTLEDTLFVDNKLNLERNAVGARAVWSQSGAYQTGFYFSPIVQFVSAKVSGTGKSSGNPISATASGITLTGIGGYQWFWDSFNMSLGAGLQVGAQASKVTVVEAGTSRDVSAERSAGAALDFMLGWTF